VVAALTTALSVPGAAGASSARHLVISHTTVSTRRGPLGVHLTTAHGRSLYMFTIDTRTRSHCLQLCPAEWPPLTTSGAPVAAGAARADKLGTIRRPDGSRQVTYAGHPLYRYAGDVAAGQTNGQGLIVFGGTWWLVAPSGRRITG
jgi:predicted lipoprotein with Yx(FWY)xxD motif